MAPKVDVLSAAAWAAVLDEGKKNSYRERYLGGKRTGISKLLKAVADAQTRRDEKKALEALKKKVDVQLKLVVPKARSGDRAAVAYKKHLDAMTAEIAKRRTAAAQAIKDQSESIADELEDDFELTLDVKVRAPKLIPGVFEYTQSHFVAQIPMTINATSQEKVLLLGIKKDLEKRGGALAKVFEKRLKTWSANLVKSGLTRGLKDDIDWMKKNQTVAQRLAQAAEGRQDVMTKADVRDVGLLVKRLDVIESDWKRMTATAGKREEIHFDEKVDPEALERWANAYFTTVIKAEIDKIAKLPEVAKTIQAAVVKKNAAIGKEIKKKSWKVRAGLVTGLVVVLVIGVAAVIVTFGAAAPALGVAGAAMVGVGAGTVAGGITTMAVAKALHSLKGSWDEVKANWDVEARAVRKLKAEMLKIQKALEPKDSSALTKAMRECSLLLSANNRKIVQVRKDLAAVQKDLARAVGDEAKEKRKLAADFESALAGHLATSQEISELLAKTEKSQKSSHQLWTEAVDEWQPRGYLSASFGKFKKGAAALKAPFESMFGGED